MSAGYRAVQWSPGKRRYDAAALALLTLYLAIFLGATFTTRPEITVETALIRAFGTAALLLLHVILAIGPLARLDRRFLPLLWNRRHLGVTMFLCALAHAALALVQFHALGDQNPFVSLLASNTRFGSIAHFPFQQLGLAALVILFLMAATSHDFWLANLTAPVWKGLHLAVYPAYGLVVGHVALGVLQDERSPVPALVLALGFTALVVLHLAAAHQELAVDRELAAADRDGFVDVCAVHEIAEKRARVVVLTDERVAVFRHDGKISAISNVCQHQNGPLGEGKIVDGCVTCPWHGYQYRPEDGASPPPFTEKVPTFRVRVVQGRVLVDPRPLPAGTPVEPATFDAGTTISPVDREEFFVGYLPLPAGLKGFLSRAAGALAVLFALVGAALGATQEPLGKGEFEFGVISEVEGLLRVEPVPLLWKPLPEEGDPAGVELRAIPLVGQFKFGIGDDVRALAGREVRLTGSWIRRGGVEMLEVASAEPVSSAATVAEADAIPLGPATLRGEIVDSKCFLGVMKPGEGKGHRDCAVRCISGGSPAALVARTGVGETAVLLLVTPEGRALGRELLELVAEPVEVEGEVLRLGGLALLETDLAAIRRTGGAGAP